MAESEEITFLDNLADCERVFPAIGVHRLIAVHCDGVNLCRAGTLAVLALKTPGQSFVFDVLKLGQEVFQKGLQEILEDGDTVKLMFDCREDSDSLWHHFKVKINNVLDLQLTQILYDRKYPHEKPLERTSRSWGRDTRERVCGLACCLEWYLPFEEGLLVQKKSKGVILKLNSGAWNGRPLGAAMHKHAVVEVKAMFPLYRKFKARLNDATIEVLMEESARYAALCRDQETRTFVRNNLLPADILVTSPAVSAYMSMSLTEEVNLIDRADKLEETFSTIHSHQIIAIHCEGDGFMKPLSILALKTPERCYLFDVMKLGPGVFEKGLKGILEDSAILKLVFDHRENSKNLWYQFKVKLTNVLDLQLLEDAYELKFHGEASRRLENTGNTRSKPRRNLHTCVDAHIPEETPLLIRKRAKSNITETDPKAWLKRPLGVVMRAFAAEEVQTMFPLYQEFCARLDRSLIDDAVATVSESLADLEDITLVDNKDDMKSAVSAIRSRKLIAVHGHCKGQDLHTSGELAILAIKTRASSFVFDVTKLGPGAFESGLKDILEDGTTVKLMFDCRQQSDALWHQFKVKLNNVLDLQLLQVAFERMPVEDTRMSHRELPGLLSSVATHRIPTANLLIRRQKGKGENRKTQPETLNLNYALDIAAQASAVAEVQAMFPLYQRLSVHLNQAVVEMVVKGSARYAALLRDRPERTYDEFQYNNLLPMYILVEPPADDKLKYECKGCGRKFPCKFPPRGDFSETGFGMMCPVCQSVSGGNDV